MENIVTASSSGLPATNAATSAASGGAAAADGQFGMLVASELSAHTATPSKAGKSAGGKDDSTTAPMLIAALMQYGSLLGILPLQGNTAQQGDAAQQGDTTQTADTVQTGNAAQQAQPTSTANLLSSGSSAGIMLLQQLSAQQGGQTEDFSLIASRLLANMGQATDAGQTATNQPVQDARGIVALLETLGGKGAQAAGASQAASAGQAAQQPGQTVDAAQGTQSGTQALLEIRQLFASLIEGDQSTTQANPAPAAGQSTPAVLLKSAAAPLSPEKDSTPQPKGAAQTLQAVLDAIEPDAGPAAQQGGAQADAGKSEKGKTLAALPGKAADVADKAEPTPAAKTGTVDFSGALRAAHSTVAAATAGIAQETKQSSTVSKSSAEAFDSIVDKITAMQNSSQKEMEISLKPDFLGKVTIRLSMDGGSLVAKIAASNPKVQDAFASQASALQNSLSDQGLKNVRIVVTSTSVPDASLQQQSENRGQSRREQEKRNNPVIVDAAAGTPAGQPLMAYEQVYRAGSVNRLA